MKEKENKVLRLTEIKDWTEGILKENDLSFKYGNFLLQRGIKDISQIYESFYENSRFYKISEIGYDGEAPNREAFENILATIHNSGEYNFIYLLSGDENGVSIYLGMVKNYSAGKKTSLTSMDYGEMLKDSLMGNFQGSKLEKRDGKPQSYILTEKQVEENIVNPLTSSNRLGVVVGVPSLNEYDDETGRGKINFQGMDRLINSMLGTRWHLLIVCEPVRRGESVILKDELYSYYNKIHLEAKRSFQFNETSGENSTESKGRSEGESWGRTKGESASKTYQEGEGSSSGGSSSSRSKNKSRSDTKGTSKSESRTENTSITYNETKGISKNKGFTTNIEVLEKRYQDIVNYFDEVTLKRINLGIKKGLFKTAIYTFAPNLSTLKKLQNNIISIFQGDEPSFSPLTAVELNKKNFEFLKTDMFKAVLTGQIFEVENNLSKFEALIYGRPQYDNRLSVSTYLTTKEVSIIASFPTKEVPGVSLKEGIDFGLNIPKVNKGINIGYVLNKGYALKDNRVFIDKDILNKHIFMAGVTGSGKTTTAQKILLESKLPFMVIEPAKTEYRILFNDKRIKDNLEIYTLGSEDSPFRFNPFELIKGESITSHIDILKASFTAAFPMEAAMPYLIEEAIYRIYEDYGWDIDTTENYNTDNPYTEDGEYWPIFSDMLNALKKVIEEKGFGNELKSNYIGALVSRFSNFLIGSKGKMLNCRKSIDIERLLDKAVIFELEELKDPREKSLIMGFILGRISQAVKLKHENNPSFKHITLIEEAHRLLARFMPGDDGSKKLGVEVFTDMLAEVRKYGESFIIIDQIPNKLTPEVLKNTNTKIIHRIFAKDDKEIIGNTMALNEGQKEYLSVLRVGEVIMFSQDWNKAVNLQIEKTTDTSRLPLNKDEIKKIALKQINAQKSVYFPEFKEYFEQFTLEEMQAYQSVKKHAFKLLADIVNTLNLPENKKFPENIGDKLLKLFERKKIKNKKIVKVLLNEIIIKNKKRFNTDNLGNMPKNIGYFLEFLFNKNLKKINELLQDRVFFNDLRYLGKIF